MQPLEQLRQQRACFRPKIPCAKCKGTLVLYWDERASSALWIHSGKNPSPCDSSETDREVYVRQAARRMLFNALNSTDMAISVRRPKCATCGSTRPVVPFIASGASRPAAFLSERAVGEGDDAVVYDIAGVDATGAVVCGVELANTPRVCPTKRNTVHSHIPWIEVRPEIVLKALDVRTTPTSLELDDVSPSKELPSGGMCEYEYCGIVTRLCKQSNVMLGETLGYCTPQRYYSCDATRLVDCASLGHYYVIRAWSASSSYRDATMTPNRHFAWLVLQRRRQCLFCSREYDSTKWKPYCTPCWRNIIYHEDDPGSCMCERGQTNGCSVVRRDAVAVSSEKQASLLVSLRFLHDVPGGSSTTAPCSLCKCVVQDQPRQQTPRASPEPPEVGHISWLGTRKYICSRCLEAECVRHGLVDPTTKREIHRWAKPAALS
jgi:hypothetical protein